MPEATMPPEPATAEQNSEWFNHQNLAAYVGLWVAVVNRKVVATGKDAKTVMAKARTEAPDEIPFIVTVPEGILTA